MMLLASFAKGARAELVQIIGNTIVLYKESRENKQLQLPIRRLVMKKIGILGGTFNPPHIGHLIIANEVLDALNLDEIRFMPNYVPPHKEKSQESISE